MANSMSQYRQNGVDYIIDDPTVAPVFVESAAYAAGKYVKHQGNLYRFTTNHAAGAWNASEVTQAIIGNEVSDLKSASLSYKGSLEPTDNIDLTVSPGAYYVTLNGILGTLPTGIDTTKPNGMLEVMGVGNFVTQKLTQLQTGYVYTRSITSANSWTTWAQETTSSDIASAVRFVGDYGSGNIDNLKSPGYYYVTLNFVGGTLPPTMQLTDGTNGFLTVQAYANFVTQTLTQFLTGKTFVRGANTIASLTFNPWVELSNEEHEPIIPTIDTRNLWNSGDIDGTGYVIIGTSGTELFPAGKYTMSFDFELDEYYVNFNVYGASGALLQKQLKRPANGHPVIQIDASSSRIERIFIQTKSGNSSSNTFQLTNIQFERIWWSGYLLDTSSSWDALPYTTPYVEHEIPVANALTEYKSNWEGKTFLFNGDSITQGLNFYPIDPPIGMNGRIGYVSCAVQLLKPGKVYNYAIGGTRLAHVEGTSDCLVDRLSAMATDADLVFIMCNTNDYASQVPIGTDDSTDISTYKGALNALFDWLRTNYAQKTVIISTQLTRKINYQDNVELPIKIEEYAQAVRDRVAAYHFILYDAYNLSGMDLRTSPTDGTGITNDGLHPNPVGAELLGRKVAAFINAQ